MVISLLQIVKTGRSEVAILFLLVMNSLSFLDIFWMLWTKMKTQNSWIVRRSRINKTFTFFLLSKFRNSFKRLFKWVLKYRISFSSSMVFDPYHFPFNKFEHFSWTNYSTTNFTDLEMLKHIPQRLENTYRKCNPINVPYLTSENAQLVCMVLTLNPW